MNTFPKVCVVTVTYSERGHLLQQVVESLFVLENSHTIHHILIVDNGSGLKSKATLQELMQNDSRVSVLEQNSNRGSAQGFRKGLEAALGTGCDYIWLLDDDNQPDTHALTALFQALSQLPDDKVLLSIRSDRPQYLEYAQGKSFQLSFGRTASFLGFSWRDVYHKVVRRFMKDVVKQNTATPLVSPRAVPYAPYGGLFFHQRHLKQIGFPVNDFFLYGDDHEFSYRFTQHGIAIYVVPLSQLTDIDQSWYLQKSMFFVSPFILVKSDPNRRKRLFYTIRNRAFFEQYKLYGQSFEYFFNMILYLVILALLSLVAVLRHGSLEPFRSYHLVLQAVINGTKRQLGETL